MRLTKLEHAALLIDDSGERIVIDPGKFTAPIPSPNDVVAIVITHEHDDHWTPAHLGAILAQSPGARVIGPAGVAAAAGAAGFDVETVAAGDELGVGAFRLRFFGGRHAVIHSSIPVIDNVGVLVNESIYYAGDSFAVPDGVAVEVLAAPAGAPWMKISEAMDYVERLAPRRAFATHEMLLSRAGIALSHLRLAWAVEQGGGAYLALEPGDTIEL